MEILPPDSTSQSSGHRGWWRELNRYHWFVFVVASLGWLFDTMDQQLFNLARVPAMNELLTGNLASKGDFYGPLTTSIFLIGWATGGLAFGVMGDRVGRAKTMMLTILLYSLCTGLSALSVSVWDFAFYRFLTGLGVGGEFAVGVALVAEVMPNRARPFALGLLQALSAVGNVTAALIGIMLGQLEGEGSLGAMSSWRIMFIIGTLPALLALLIRRRLKEPERWKEVAEHAVQRQLGSYRELLGDPRWRHRAIIGLLLATSGVIGVWGIGFFIQDLTTKLFRKQFEAEAREKKEADHDREFVLLAMANPAELADIPEAARIKADRLLTPDATNDAGVIFGAALYLHGQKLSVQKEAVLAILDQHVPANSAKPGQSSVERERRASFLGGESGDGSLSAHVPRILKRTKSIDGRLITWSGYVLLMFHTAGFFGMYSFGVISHFLGRRGTFAIAFVAAMTATALVFAFIRTQSDVFWMVPLMGLCQMSVFGGYAIYFPELFPTRLRSTGTSFCYNVGRFAAASGPIALGLFATTVFGGWTAEPFRWAGVTMCAVYLIGLLALPFAPETRGQPLPE
ncbi:MAG: MFS transporter [Planctomycetes bacterium]|nr:MFS transporter [Planctomycetota bacterium]